MGKLDGKVAIITGASSGVGEGTAIAYAKEGAKVVICARRAEKLQNTANECAKFGAEVLPVICDIGKIEDLENLVNTTMEKFGRIDILVNNAIASQGSQVVSIMDHTDEIWNSIMDTGLKDTYNLMRLCYPIMAKQKFGRIINLSSALAYQGAAMFVAYAACKAGIRTLSMVAAREWGPDITVNTMSPLCITEQSNSAFDVLPQEAIDGFLPPLGYFGDVLRDIAPPMVFLASDDAHYITGQNFNIDGGLEIHF